MLSANTTALPRIHTEDDHTQPMEMQVNHMLPPAAFVQVPPTLEHSDDHIPCPFSTPSDSVDENMLDYDAANMDVTEEEEKEEAVTILQHEVARQMEQMRQEEAQPRKKDRKKKRRVAAPIDVDQDKDVREQQDGQFQLPEFPPRFTRSTFSLHHVKQNDSLPTYRELMEAHLAFTAEAPTATRSEPTSLSTSSSTVSAPPSRHVTFGRSTTSRCPRRSSAAKATSKSTVTRPSILKPAQIPSDMPTREEKVPIAPRLRQIREEQLRTRQNRISNIVVDLSNSSDEEEEGEEQREQEHVNKRREEEEDSVQEEEKDEKKDKEEEKNEDEEEDQSISPATSLNQSFLASPTFASPSDATLPLVRPSSYDVNTVIDNIFDLIGIGSNIPSSSTPPAVPTSKSAPWAPRKPVSYKKRRRDDDREDDDMMPPFVARRLLSSAQPTSNIERNDETTATDDAIQKQALVRRTQFVVASIANTVREYRLRPKDRLVKYLSDIASELPASSYHTNVYDDDDYSSDASDSSIVVPRPYTLHAIATILAGHLDDDDNTNTPVNRDQWHHFSHPELRQDITIAVPPSLIDFVRHQHPNVTPLGPICQPSDIFGHEQVNIASTTTYSAQRTHRPTSGVTTAAVDDPHHLTLCNHLQHRLLHKLVNLYRRYRHVSISFAQFHFMWRLIIHRAASTEHRIIYTYVSDFISSTAITPPLNLDNMRINLADMLKTPMATLFVPNALPAMGDLELDVQFGRGLHHLVTRHPVEWDAIGSAHNNRRALPQSSPALSVEQSVLGLDSTSDVVLTMWSPFSS